MTMRLLNKYRKIGKIIFSRTLQYLGILFFVQQVITLGIYQHSAAMIF